MRIQLVFLPAFLLFALTSQAQENLSLSDAIQLGLDNNYQIKIAEARTEIAANNGSWAIAGRVPTVNLTANSLNNYRNLSNPAGPLTASNTLNTGITPGIEASMILFDGYRIKITKEQLEKQNTLSQSNQQLVVQNSIQSIINAYYNALVQKEQLNVLDEVLTLSRDRVAYQEVRKEFGQSSTFDILQTQDAYLNDSTNYVLQTNTFEAAIRNLNLAMGVDDLGTSYLLTDTLTYAAEAYQLSDLQEEMESNNVQLRTEYINRELSSINTRLQQSAFRPTVQVQAGATYNVGISFGEQTLSFGPNETVQEIPQIAAKTFQPFLNLSASYPIYDGGARKTRLENAQKEELIAQLNINDLKRTLNNQLANTLATYNTQMRLVEVTTNLVDNAKRNLEIAEERFRGGLINSFDYRTIQVSYINASQQRLNAVFNLKNTETELIRLIGGLVR
ncbi:MAG: TolC family protein [Phaeodactylibacter sp.]|nr:TolC family protein [Phaeodactylibacter sp.]